MQRSPDPERVTAAEVLLTNGGVDHPGLRADFLLAALGADLHVYLRGGSPAGTDAIRQTVHHLADCDSHRPPPLTYLDAPARAPRRRRDPPYPIPEETPMQLDGLAVVRRVTGRLRMI